MVGHEVSKQEVEYQEQRTIEYTAAFIDVMKRRAAELELSFSEYMLYEIMDYVSGMQQDILSIEDRLAYVMNFTVFRDYPYAPGELPKESS